MTDFSGGSLQLFAHFVWDNWLYFLLAGMALLTPLIKRFLRRTPSDVLDWMVAMLSSVPVMALLALVLYVESKPDFFFSLTIMPR